MADFEHGVLATTMHVRRSAAGDLDSLSWLVARLSPLLLAQAEFRLGSTLRQRVDPQDLVQEAWAIALPRLGSLEPRDGRLTPVLLKFLSTTLTYRINNLLRSNLAAREQPLETQAELSAQQSGVITGAVRRETQHVVRRSLDELEQVDREVILLRGIEQHSAKTVAVMLGISPAAVDQRYSRALRRLRQRLPESVFAEIED